MVSYILKHFFILLIILVLIGKYGYAQNQAIFDEDVNKGIQYGQQGDLKNARKSFEKALSKGSQKLDAYSNREANAYYNLGAIDNHEKKPNKAIVNLTKAIEKNGYFAEAYAERGLAYTANGLYNQAMEDFNKSIALNPNLSQAYSNRGNFYVKKGDIDLAFADFNKAIRLNPNLAVSYYN